MKDDTGLFEIQPGDPPSDAERLPSLAPTSRASLIWATVAIAWLLVVGGGSLALVSYAGDAGRSDPAPIRWPGDSTITLAGDRPTLVFFLHPKCPCTRASLMELERVLATGPHVSVQVCVVGPAELRDQWLQTGTACRARSIASGGIVYDADGTLAARYGAKTSGHVVLYGLDGALKFSGGITAARGHEGDNTGKSAIAALLRGQTTTTDTTPVFGCTLCSDLEVPDP